MDEDTKHVNFQDFSQVRRKLNNYVSSILCVHPIPHVQDIILNLPYPCIGILYILIM